VTDATDRGEGRRGGGGERRGKFRGCASNGIIYGSVATLNTRKCGAAP
jgi:hypothetical protein